MRETQNYGLAGGKLDATKHIELARDPARYMRRLAERPWLAAQIHAKRARSGECSVVRLSPN